jgi:hypothetical protein
VRRSYSGAGKPNVLHPLFQFRALRQQRTREASCLSGHRAAPRATCDDAALRIGLLPPRGYAAGYAGHLLKLAGQFETQLAIPMASTSHLESRVKSINSQSHGKTLIFGPCARRHVAIARTSLILALLNGEPIKVITPIQVNFKLTQ